MASWNDTLQETERRLAQPSAEREARTVLVKIHLEEHNISWKELDRVFTRFGYVDYIEVFDRGTPFHSRIRFQNPEDATEAFEQLNGRCIYDHCCRLELSLCDANSIEDALVSSVNFMESLVSCSVEFDDWRTKTDNSSEDAYQVLDRMPMRNFCEFMSAEVESKLRETNQRLEDQLSHEREARLNAERMAEEAKREAEEKMQKLSLELAESVKSVEESKDHEINKLRGDLQHAKQMADDSQYICTIM